MVEKELGGDHANVHTYGVRCSIYERRVINYGMEETFSDEATLLFTERSLCGALLAVI